MRLFCFSRSSTGILARRIYQSRHDAEFKVDVDIKCCVHGYLARDKKQPASLIIFAPQLVCVEHGTFNLFRLEVEFLDQPESGKPCKPVIIATAPYSVEERLYEEIVEVKNKTTHSVKKTKKIKATAGVAEASVKAGVGGEVGTETQESKMQEYTTRVHYFSTGSSNTRVDDDTGRRSGVWWNVKKSSNPKTGDDAGIPPNYLFAVLLTRSADASADANSATPFEAHFRLFAEAGWAHKREKLVEIVTGHLLTRARKKARGRGGGGGGSPPAAAAAAAKRPPAVRHSLSQELADFAAGNYEGRPPPMVFDPRVKLEGDCRGVDRMQLGRYTRPERLLELTMGPKP